MSYEKQMFCDSCTKYVVCDTTDVGYVCCTFCGKVLSEENLIDDSVTFGKDAQGRSKADGNIVPIGPGSSRERTLNRAYDFITYLMDTLGVGGGDLIASPAVRLYEIAVEKNFVRGRRAEQVQAACLYIACRDNNKPFLLIEFSELLTVNVYVLGAVFLQLCKLLHLQEHPIVRKLVDPSLFIHRFVHGLLRKIDPDVEKTALFIMTSMKRDWMQTGRKPSGLCGAALYISALSHGYKFSKAEVVKVVHICEATLTKRLIEFEDTESGSLTMEEFTQKAEELENVIKHTIVKGNMSKSGELLCQHKGTGKNHFAHGLCEACYEEFMILSGGLDGGSEPPAFQCAERERLAKASTVENAKNSLLDDGEIESICNNPTVENVTRLDAVGADQMKTSRAVIEHEVLDGVEGISETANVLGSEGDDESDNFSDINDEEVNAYLHNEEEARFKKMIWEKVNWEYIEEQAQKAAAGVLNVPKPKKERQQKKMEGLNAQTAAEAAHQMLSKKRVSSKLNCDRLKELFDEPVLSDTPKKMRTDSFPEEKNETEDEVEDEFENPRENNAYEDDQDDPYYCEEDGFDDGLF